MLSVTLGSQLNYNIPRRPDLVSGSGGVLVFTHKKNTQTMAGARRSACFYEWFQAEARQGE